MPGSHDWDAGQTRMATLAHLKTRLSLPGNSILDQEGKGTGALSTQSDREEDIFVLNTHFDDRGRISRQKASEIILEKLRPIMNTIVSGKSPLVVVMGDLNSPANEEGYQVLTGHRYVRGRQADPNTFLDSRHAMLNRTSSSCLSLAAQNPLLSRSYGCNGTFTDFRAKSQGGIIDFVLIADNGVLIERDGVADAPRFTCTRYGVLPNKIEDGIYPFRLSDHCMVLTTLSFLS